MNFTDGQPIFIQIAERLNDEILAGIYLADSRVPGVRDYSVLLEVNVNTTVKAYDLLAQRGALYSKRGLGYFVAPEAQQIILDNRRRHFFETEVPRNAQQLQQLGISLSDVTELLGKELHKQP
jgi:DNA-binding transcriptional regulator YhcF (GntR family)